MAKELPFFKFEPGQWESGSIQMCTRDSKGLFIDLCSLYWSRLGELPYALALQKLCNGNKDALHELENNDIFCVNEGFIIIEFLDEQLNEFQETSKKRAKAANKRWSDASALHVQSKSNAIREDKIREEEIREDKKNATAEILPFDSENFKYAWNEWLAYKKEKKQRLTQKTKEMQLRKLGTVTEDEAIGMIGQSIQNGWAGLFEYKNNKQNGRIFNAQATLDRLNSYGK